MKGQKLLVLLALLVCAAPAFAAVDAFLKINGINGEAQGTHQGWIEVESWSWAASNPASCSSNAATFSVREAATTPKMVLMTTQGKLLPAVTVDVKGQQHVLDNVMFTSAKVSPNAASPATTFTLNFTRCETHGGTANASMMPTRLSTPTSKVLIGLTPRPEAFNFTSFQFQGRNGAIILQSNPGSNNFFQQAFQSKQTFPSITVRKAGKGQQEYFEVKLKEVLVSSYQVMGDGSVKIGLNFTKADGSTTGFQDAH